MKILIKENLAKTIKNLENSSKKMNKLMPKTMFRALSLLEAQIKQNIRTRMNVRSGTLLNSVQKDMTVNGGSVTGTVGPEGVPYAAAQEFGATIPAHFIAPRNKLALKWSVGGKNFFSKGHMIPSFQIPAKNYMSDAVTKLVPIITEELELFMQKELEKN